MNRKKVFVILGTAMTAITAVGAVIFFKKRKEQKDILDSRERGSFYASKNTTLKKEPGEDASEEKVFPVFKDELLDSVVFENEWYRVKVRGKEGYLAKNEVYYLYDFLKDNEESVEYYDEAE